MLLPRIIPCLLIHRGGLVKTVKFQEPKYIGDPLNTVRIFNEKAVDELLVVDIDASRFGVEPNYSLIKAVAAECRMPLCYAGGVNSVAVVEKITSLGVEKVGISSGFINDSDLVAESACRVGSQSIVVIIDAQNTGKKKKKYEVFIRNGTENTKQCPFALAERAQASGAGEIVINSIECDGMMGGYDMDLIKGVRDAVCTPITALGGAGSYEDFRALVDHFGIIGAGAGSLFVFKGKYKAVLIQYPDWIAKKNIFYGGLVG